MGFRRFRVGVVGFGWMGKAHSRSLLRLPLIFPERELAADLVICADANALARELATEAYGFARASADWRDVVASDDVDIVYVASPNMTHVEIVEAAANAGKDIFCEKPVGGTPAHTMRAASAASAAGVISGVGYNYRWAPMVQEARAIIKSGTIGDVTNYRGRFLSMYGSNPLNLLTWRYLIDEGGYGVSSDLMSHAVDLAEFLIGPLSRVVGVTETFIKERPLPSVTSSHYTVGRASDPRGAVTNEDYAGMLGVFVNGARASFEASRSMVGPESQMAFEVYGTEGALSWNLERMSELNLFVRSDGRHAGWRTIFGGDRFPYHGNFVPGNANGIGFEDLVTIEDLEYLDSVAQRRPHHPGFDDALRFVTVQAALLRSVASSHWEEIGSLEMT